MSPFANLPQRPILLEGAEPPTQYLLGYYQFHKYQIPPWITSKDLPLIRNQAQGREYFFYPPESF